MFFSKCLNLVLGQRLEGLISGARFPWDDIEHLYDVDMMLGRFNRFWHPLNLPANSCQVRDMEDLQGRGKRMVILLNQCKQRAVTKRIRA